MAKMDLNNDDEKVNIESIFWSAMDMLSDDDRKLPQVSCYHVFTLRDVVDDTIIHLYLLTYLRFQTCYPY